MRSRKVNYFFLKQCGVKFSCLFDKWLCNKTFWFKCENSCFERFYGLFSKKYPCNSVDYCLEGSSFSIGNHRNPESHSLDRYQSEVLFRWEEKCSCSSKETILLFLRYFEFPGDVWFWFFLEFSIEKIIGICYENEIFPIFIKRIYEKVEFFVGDTSSNWDIVWRRNPTVRCIISKVCGTRSSISDSPRLFQWYTLTEVSNSNSWINYYTFPIVILLDSFSRILRICYKVINLLCSFIIEFAQPSDESIEDESRKGIPPSEFHHISIFLIVTPVVANRSVAVDNNLTSRRE